MKDKGSSFTTKDAVLYKNWRKERAYKKLEDGSASAIDSSLKPKRNILTGEIEITTPDGKKEVYKEERSLTGRKYKKVK